MPDNHNLSDREIEILRLVATGASNKEIGSALHITTNTVKVHLRNIFEKINVSSRTEAALYAINQGLTGPVLPNEVEVKEKDDKEDSIELEANPKAELQTTTEKKVGINRFLLFVPVIVLGVVLIVFILRAWMDARDFKDPLIDESKPVWQSLPVLPEGRSGMAFVVFQNQLISIGGKNADGVIDSVSRLSVDTQTWEELPGKPVAVHQIHGVVEGGNIYVPGGLLASGEATDVMEMFSPSTLAWIELAPMPEPRAGYGLAAMNGHIYVFGGWDGEEFKDSVYRYQVELGKWEELTAMTSKRGYLSTAVYNGRIYLFGGKDDQGTSNLVEIFEIDENSNPEGSWKKVKSLPSPRSNMGVVTLVNMIFIVGGSDDDVKALPGWVYYPDTQEWKTFNAPAETALIDPGVSGVDTNLFLVGGDVNGLPAGEAFYFKAFYTALLPLVR